jgi:CDP-diacylglycerol--serine O-phosphatidyltransferase
MNIIKHLPNALTLGNLFCGFAGIICSFIRPDLPTAWFVWAACLFDFLDGFAARALKVTSPIGKELDSLADVVSFGVLPSIFIYRLLDSNGAGYFAWSAFALAAMAALRLAKFNTDTRQSYGFIGLPTPAHALFITGILFLIDYAGLQSYTLQIGLGAVGAMSWLMVSEISLPALKFKSFSWKENKLTWIIPAGSLILIVLMKEAGIPASILFYILISLIYPSSGKE